MSLEPSYGSEWGIQGVVPSQLPYIHGPLPAQQLLATRLLCGAGLSRHGLRVASLGSRWEMLAVVAKAAHCPSELGCSSHCQGGGSPLGGLFLLQADAWIRWP